MTAHPYDYDVLVLGAGAAGQAAAQAAARHGRRVAIIEPRLGVALGRRPPGVTMIVGNASFEDPHTIAVSHEWEESRDQVLTAEHLIITTGSDPEVELAEDASLGEQASDREPDVTSAIVVGAGGAGIERASELARPGIDVTVVEERPRILDGCDVEVADVLKLQLAQRGVRFRLGQRVDAVERHGNRPVARLDTGGTLVADVIAFAGGQRGRTGQLRLERAGLLADAKGRLRVDPLYRTRAGHILAAGSVLGRPLGAPRSIDQGNTAGAAAAGQSPRLVLKDRVGIVRSQPELAFAGATEEELVDERAPYEVGTAPLLGGGLLKVLVDTERRCVVGIHAVGPAASALVSAGQRLLDRDDGVEALARAVAHHPVLGPYLVAGQAVSERLDRSSRRLVA